mgnify:FL=1
MKVTYMSKDSKFVVELEGKSQTDIFQQIASFQEVFEADEHCGRCNSEKHKVRFVVRTVEDNDFYELQCQNPACRAKLAFGVNKKGGTLFPKRFEDGKIKGKNGWTKFNRETGKEE